MAVSAGCRPIYRHGPRDDGGYWPVERFILSLHSGDTAWLPSVQVLLLPSRDRPKGYRPLADLCSKLNWMLAVGVIIVDDRAKVSTKTPVEWANHVIKEGARASNGERPEQVRRRSALKSKAPRLPGLKMRWHAPEMADQLERQRVIWTGAGTLDRVMRQLDKELRDCGSRTLYDILGPRRPDDPGAGGRGKKRGSR